MFNDCVQCVWFRNHQITKLLHFCKTKPTYFNISDGVRVCVFLLVRVRVNKVDMDTRKFIIVTRFEPVECSISKRTVFKLCYNAIHVTGICVGS